MVNFVKTAQYKILFTVDGDTLEIESISQKTGISRSTVRKYLKQLEKEGLVKQVDEFRFTLTDKGRLFKECVTGILKDQGSTYVLTDPGTGQPLTLSFRNYKQLLAIYKYGLAPREVLEEHFKRGYIQNWIKEGVKDKLLAEELNTGGIKTFEDLITYLEKILSIVDQIE